jgi:hypothetical protein
MTFTAARQQEKPTVSGHLASLHKKKMSLAALICGLELMLTPVWSL